MPNTLSKRHKSIPSRASGLVQIANALIEKFSNGKVGHAPVIRKMSFSRKPGAFIVTHAFGPPGYCRAGDNGKVLGASLSSRAGGIDGSGG